MRYRMPDTVPSNIRRLVGSNPLVPQTSSEEYSVYKMPGSPSRFLKVGDAAALQREAEMDAYFNEIGWGVPMLGFETTGETGFLVTEEAPGIQGIDPLLAADQERLARVMGLILAKLHDLQPDGCPVADRTAAYLEEVDKGFRSGRFDPVFAQGHAAAINTEDRTTNSDADSCPNVADSDDFYTFISENRHLLQSDTLIHGDFCLPNLFFQDDGSLRLIDCGSGGIGDRHVDLFWGAWTFHYNFGRTDLADIFFDAYGVDRIDPTVLKLVALCETFG